MRTIVTMLLASLVLAAGAWLVFGRSGSKQGDDAVAKACASAITALQANQNAVDAADDVGAARDRLEGAGATDIAGALDQLANVPGSQDDKRANALRLLSSLCAAATASP